MTQSLLKQLSKQQRTRCEILQKTDLIPPLPDLVAVLLGVLNKPDAKAEDLEALLQNDQVLVARMLAMVNSPFYGMNRSIHTIKEAVAVLGFRGVRSLVLAAGSTKFLQQDFSWYGHQPKGLWLHSVCVAAGSRLLARHCGLSSDQCEQAFVGGLLHDIGKLSLVTYVQGGPSVTTEDSVIEYERMTVGLDHAEAGALVTASWNLSSEIQSIIARHHSEGSLGDHRAISCVRLADCVAHDLGFGYLENRAPRQEVRLGDLAAVGLDDAGWESARTQVVSAMAEAVLDFESLGT